MGVRRLRRLHRGALPRPLRYDAGKYESVRPVNNAQPIRFRIASCVSLECTPTPNEKEVSYRHQQRTVLGGKVWKSSQRWSARRSAVRSVAWLDAFVMLDKPFK